MACIHLNKLNKNIVNLNSKYTYYFYCTSTLLNTTGESNKKKEYYKNIGIVKDSDVKPQGWDEARPFSEVPGPKPSPIFGNLWRFILPIGDFYKMDLLQIHKSLYEKYGEVVLLKGIPRVNEVVHIYNPNDIEKIARNEGAWPVRIALLAFSKYRMESKKDIFKDFPGVLTVQGEEWFKARSAVNPILLQPKIVKQYTASMDEIASDFVNKMKYLELNNNGEMPDNFIEELNKWALESIAYVVLDKRIGCLDENLEENSDALALIRSIKEMFELIYHLEMVPNVFTRSVWKKFFQVMDIMADVCMKNIEEATKRFETDKENTCVLKQFIEKDKKFAFVMAIDMLMAGIDTTGRMVAALLYYLAKCPDKQKKFRDEILKYLPHKDSPVTSDILNECKYVNATVKEALRIAPIAIGNARTTVKDMVLGGYQIPKGTNVLTSNLFLSQSETNYKNAMEFIPERWLRDSNDEYSFKTVHPFVTLPFGFGPRSCIGRRIAMMEIETALIKIIRNFELSWRHEDMVFKTYTLHGIAKPLNIHIKSLPN